ncbi:alkaline phosphatase family protein [Sphingomonas profundi]|uniref:alkaline phosphatase family protein n=1 Tax=Alterirhizorhabdus profundi TaxID=2681549 RepID=UPI0012E71234|nr:alkaline phosphatase family protein [Sphingomonas profundi]
MRVFLTSIGLAAGLAAATAPAAAAGAQPATAAAAPPRLVVAISVDQFSANLFEEWRPRFTAGLKRLSGGIVYPSGYQSHAATETCPGHSTMLTGRHPNKTGIVANSLRDETSGKTVYCLADSDVQLAHDKTAPGVSPKKLRVDTLGEWLKAASPQSRVVAVSGKDRGAINMAGHNPDGVFWLFPGYGFTTYVRPGEDGAKALAPLAALTTSLKGNWLKPPRWTYAHADCRAAAGTWTVAGQPFRSDLPPAGYGTSDKPADLWRNVMASPTDDRMTEAAAERLIDHYRLGRGPATDLLAISFSGTDYVGHAYGTRGPEMCEQLHSLDAGIGALLAKLDKLAIPYLVMLTADHGGSDLVERLAAEGYPAGRVDGDAIVQRMNAAVMAETGATVAPFAGSLDELALVPAIAAADRPRMLAAAKRALAGEPDVAAAFTLDEILATPVPRGKAPDELSLQERFAESAYRGRSGDLLVAARPYTAPLPRPGSYIAGHGSVWNYDRRVPILFWWKGAPAQTRFLPVETVDIAPTLAAILGLTPPGDVDGRCLALGAIGATACPVAAAASR